jgi:hypothetical protein
MPENGYPPALPDAADKRPWPDQLGRASGTVSGLIRRLPSANLPARSGSPGKPEAPRATVSTRYRLLRAREAQAHQLERWVADLGLRARARVGAARGGPEPADRLLWARVGGARRLDPLPRLRQGSKSAV